MTILNVGRSQLGAMQRSRLGVLTRGGTWRIIVCIELGFDWPENVNSRGVADGLIAQKRNAIRLKYRDFVDDLSQLRPVELVETTRWIRALSEPLSDGIYPDRNLVFIVGRGNPGNGEYFNNYTYDFETQTVLKGTTERVVTFISELDGNEYPLTYAYRPENLSTAPLDVYTAGFSPRLTDVKTEVLDEDLLLSQRRVPVFVFF